MVSPIDRSEVAVSLGTDLSVPAERVWALIRDFDAMPAWNASVRQSRIEDGPADRPGCRRVLVFDDGGTWTHELTGLSDADMRLQYRIVATPQPMRIPVWNYRAAIQVLADPAGAGCRVQWDAWFETMHPDEMQSRARQVFALGFDGLRRYFVA
ncbi:SRPBCC family protein [Comamonadaceae bacterium G21597-S1]|nr:SRPBCC family protein [Comamonadaceae bacterium G21597-S1]